LPTPLLSLAKEVQLATQICLVKNINSTHRVEGIPSQFGLSGALAASKVDVTANQAKHAVGAVKDKVASTLS
jgi:hypothetical protein